MSRVVVALVALGCGGRVADALPSADTARLASLDGETWAPGRATGSRGLGPTAVAREGIVGVWAAREVEDAGM